MLLDMTNKVIIQETMNSSECNKLYSDGFIIQPPEKFNRKVGGMLL
jgi:hypothetical protein